MSPAARSVFELLELTPEEWAATPRAGARAGRGFHYQDAALTLLVVRGLLGTAPVGQLVPEGRDDATLDLADQKCDAQVKSRQPSQSRFSANDLAKIAVELAQRRSAERLLVVLERGFLETGLDRRASEVDEVRQQLADALATRVGAARSGELLNQLSILVTAEPLKTAASELAIARGLRPPVTELVVQSLCAAVAACADWNAAGGSTPATLTATDASAIVDRVVELVDVAALDAALARGLCEAVDFTQTNADATYLHGVATTAAHVAGGLVIDRPDAVGAVIDALSGRRRVLVAGPSGSGKSAIVWLTVHASRHSIRWYRIRRLDEPDAVATIDRMARTLGACAERPIGFVVDDIGRLGTARWDAVIHEFTNRPGIVVLGAIREDGLRSVTTLTDVGVVRPKADEQFAEALWSMLSERAGTTWEGWREPFEIADGLTLEYVHILTSGARLDEVLSNQVQRLAKEVKGDDLIAVLGIVTVADQLGTAVTVDQLMTLTGLARTSIVAAMVHLEDEFLVRIDGVAVTGLHELRSAVSATHALAASFRTLEQTVADVVGVVNVDDLESVVPRAARLTEDAIVCTALADRLSRNSDVAAMTASLNGLRGVEREARAFEVAVDLRESLQPGDVLDAVQMRFGVPLHDSARILINAPNIADPEDELRQQFVSAVTSAPAGIGGAGPLAALIDALPACAPPSWLCDAITQDLSVSSLEDIVALLDSARDHGEDLHRVVVEALGGRTVAACATSAWHEFDLDYFDTNSLSPEARVLGADDGPFWQAADSPKGLVSQLLACSPTFEDVKVNVVGADGQLAPLTTSRPAIDKPVAAPPVVQTRSQERYRAAILAAVGAAQWTARLRSEQPLLDPLATAMHSYLSCVCCGAEVSGARARFNFLDRAAARLEPPPAAIGLLASREELERVGARREADPFTALLRHPGWFMFDADSELKHFAIVAFRLWRVAQDLRAEHRWGLLPEPADEAADRLVATLADLRLVLAQRAAMRPAAWSAVVAGARVSQDRVQHVVARARREADVGLRSERRAFERALREAGLRARIETLEDETAPAAVWPAARFLVIVSLAAAEQWRDSRERVMAARRVSVDGERAVSVLFELRDAVSG